MDVDAYSKDHWNEVIDILYKNNLEVGIGDKSKIDIITEMQGACARIGEDKFLQILIEIKSDLMDEAYSFDF